MPNETIFPRDRVTIVGVLNCTLDSFSDGGRIVDCNGRPVRESVLTAASELVRGGAHVLDVGGESTRPGAYEVADDREIDRIAPVFAWLRAEFDVPVSVDTRKSQVADVACETGASVVNDVSGGCFDPAILQVVAARGAYCVLGHMRGTPDAMHREPRSVDILGDVSRDLVASIAAAQASGIPRSRLVADPGLGFGKSSAQSFELLSHVDWLRNRLDVPMMIGTSRKGFVSKLVEADLEARDAASHAASAIGIYAGADAIRVHDATGARRAAVVAQAARAARRKELT